MNEALRQFRSSLFGVRVVPIVLGAIFAFAPAFGNEPPRPGEIAALQQSGEYGNRLQNALALGNHRIDSDLLQRAVYNANRQALLQQGVNPDVVLSAPPSSRKLMPTKGSVKVFALLIDFLDYPAYSGNDQAGLQSILFGDGKIGGTLQNPAPYESLAAYYKRASYNQLDLSGGSALGVYHAPYNRSTVDQHTAGRESVVKEAITYFHNQGVNFAQFDNDGNGQIEYFIVLWTGPNNGWSNFWWGYQTEFSDSSFTVDGKTLGKYSWQWQYSSGGSTSGPFDPRVVIHETGHALGLPDYYDYDATVGPDGGIGSLDIMDGVWGDHNAFSKWVLDWISPTVVATGSQSVTLNPSGTSKDAVVIMPGATASNSAQEFFVVQNRYRSGNDPATTVVGLHDGYTSAAYPTDGLLIWHVDATLDSSGTDWAYDNSYTAHKLLKLVQADGLDRIENFSATADAAMYYQPDKTLTALTTPNSTGYLGADTGVDISGISKSGSQITALFSIDSPHLLPTLTVALAGVGGGSVTSAPAGITCGSDCVQSYASGTGVTLTAAAAPGSKFAGWSGGGCSGTGTCFLSLIADTAVTANFATTLLLNENFDNTSDHSKPAGWSSVINAGNAWWWFSYNDSNTAGGTGYYALGATYGAGPFDEELRTPAVNLSGYDSVGFEFKTSVTGSSETADVDLSTNGGSSWTNIWEKTARFAGPQTVDIDISALAAGHSNVNLRFHQHGTGIWWVIDDVKIMASQTHASTTTAVASSLNPSTRGQSVTFTATVTPSDATGTVTFYDGASSLGSGTLSSGAATFGSSALSVASHSITAVYGGDSSHLGSTSPALAQTVNEASYSLSYAPGAGGTLSGTASQTVTYGGSGSAVRAVPNAGYRFVNWSDGSTANPRTDTNVMAALSVTANFATATVGISNIPASAVFGGSFTPNLAYAGDGVTSVTSSTAGCTVSSGVVNFVAAGTCTLTAHATATTNYGALDGAAQSFTITQATPTLTWANPPDALFGTALSATQLNATASVGGAFVYTPAAGTALSPGNGQTLSVTFTPASPNYQTVSKSVTINVRPPSSGTPVQIVITKTFTRDAVNNQIVMAMNVSNTGGTAAANVQLTTAKIGTTSAAGLPLSLGAIASGATATATVRLPGSAGAAGASVVLTQGGSYTGGSFTSAIKAVLP